MTRMQKGGHVDGSDGSRGEEWWGGNGIGPRRGKSMRLQAQELADTARGRSERRRDACGRC